MATNSTGSSVYVSIPYGAYTSSVSQYEADQQAIAAAQAYANANGTCPAVGLPKKVILLHILSIMDEFNSNTVQIRVRDTTTSNTALTTSNDFGESTHYFEVENDSNTLTIELTATTTSCFADVTSFPYYQGYSINSYQSQNYLGIPKSTEIIYLHIRNSL